MRAPAPVRRSRRGDDETIVRLQAMLERKEAVRRRAFWMVAAATVVGLVLTVAGVVALRGRASAGDVPPSAPVVAAAVVETAVPVASAAPGAAVPATDLAVAPSPAAQAPDVRTPVAKPKKAQAAKPKQQLRAQRIRIGIGSVGYEPSVVRVSSKRPVILSVERGEGCAAGFLIPKLKISADNSNGPVTIKLGRVRAGTYTFSCGMEMVTGTLIVK